MVTDETLYQQIKEGDMPAFDFLYERYRLRLFRFIFSYLKNQQEAEDLFQDAFMKVLKSEDLNFSKGSFQAWIYEVSRNLCLNQLRSRSRAGSAFESLALPEESKSAESSLSEHALSKQISNAVGQLPSDQAEVFNLKLLGVPEKEIAQTLQIPIGTVKSRFHKIIEFIRQEVIE